jgi:cell division ATPase FtsA
MKFNFFKKKEKKDEFFISLDIGEEAVKSLLFKIKEGEKEVSVISLGLGYLEKMTGAILPSQKIFRLEAGISESLKEMRRNLCFSLADKSIKEAAEKIKKWRAIVYFSPVFFKARTAKKFFTRHNPKTKINNAEAREIYSKVVGEAKAELLKSIVSESGIMGSDIYWIDFKTQDINIDGYSVSDIFSKNGKQIEFSFFASFCLKSQMEKITKAVLKSGIETISFAHPAQNMGALSRDAGKAVFIDVGEEATQFYFTDENKILRAGEFAIGGGVFTDAISKNLGIDQDSARALKEKYSARNFSEGGAAKLKDIFSGPKAAWKEELIQKAAQGAEFSLAANKIFIFGGGSLIPEIKQALLEITSKKSEGNEAAFTPQIDFIYPSNLGNIKNLAYNLNSPQFISCLLNCENAKKVF